jgi:hypothetical protein
MQRVDVGERRVVESEVALAEGAVDASPAGRRVMGVIPVE